MIDLMVEEREREIVAGASFRPGGLYIYSSLMGMVR